MKRTIFLVTLTLLLAFAAIMIDNASAERPRGIQSSNYFKWTEAIDSTVFRQVDSNTTPTGSSSKLGWFSGVQDYSTVHGYFVLEYTAIDTGADGTADLPDTTLDSVTVIGYTSATGGTPWKVVYLDTLEDIHVTASVVNGDYVAFDFSDSTLYDAVYWEIRTIVNDTNKSIPRIDATSGYDWKMSWKYYAK